MSLNCRISLHRHISSFCNPLTTINTVSLANWDKQTNLKCGYRETKDHLFKKTFIKHIPSCFRHNAFMFITCRCWSCNSWKCCRHNNLKTFLLLFSPFSKSKYQLEKPTMATKTSLLEHKTSHSVSQPLFSCVTQYKALLLLIQLLVIVLHPYFFLLVFPILF